jgi:HSP90 family molecular chaperone
MATSPSIKLGEVRDLHLSSRYYQFNRSHAIHDLFDALVELITNPDDSYHRLFMKHLIEQDGGPITIDYCAAKEKPFIAIRDHAQGMSLDEMAKKLGDVGTCHSERGIAAYGSRGKRLF